HPYLHSFPTRRSSDLPICETGDFFGLHREVDDVEPGDLIVVRSSGAYGFAMASNYNSRPRTAEVLVDHGRYGVVTDREDYTDLRSEEHTSELQSRSDL